MDERKFGIIKKITFIKWCTVTKNAKKKDKKLKSQQVT